MLQTAEIFQNGMVLQREKEIAIWGTGDQGKMVEASIQGKSSVAEVNSDRLWKIIISPLEASEGEVLSIKSDEEIITFTDVAVGEVWVAGGQSNMEFWMRYEKHKAEALETCQNRRIRFFDVPEVCYEGQLEDFDYSRQGIWRYADVDNLEYFSAVGYYFQKNLEENLSIPVGIIGCNWGGTAACVWMNPETVRKVGAPWMHEYEKKIAKMDMEKYWDEQHKNRMNDRGNPFEDPFGEFCLPKTPSEEELHKFFGNIPDNLDDFLDMLQPQAIPGSLYEHMLKRVAPYSIRGVLWYQGESDDVPGRNNLYKDMLAGMISDWRTLWGDEMLPFLIVQLPGFETWLMNTTKNQYPIIRNCQQEVTDTVENTYLCSVSDLGEERDIHPKNKKDVGNRLALLARGHVYGEEILCDAPRVKKVERNKRIIRIHFSNADGGLVIKGDFITALNVVSNDREIEYTAHVEESRLIIELGEDLEDPVSIQFAQTSWYIVNLYNQAGIPALPFGLSDVSLNGMIHLQGQ